MSAAAVLSSALTDAAKWAAPRLAIYAATVVVMTAAFFLGAFLYATFWHQLTPAPAPTQFLKPPTPAAAPANNPPQEKRPSQTELIASLDSKAIRSMTITGLAVLDAEKKKIGSVRKPTLSEDGSVESISIQLYTGSDTSVVDVPLGQVRWLFVNNFEHRPSMNAQVNASVVPVAVVLTVAAGDLQKPRDKAN